MSSSEAPFPSSQSSVHSEPKDPQEANNTKGTIQWQNLTWDTDISRFNSSNLPLPESVTRFRDPVTCSPLYKVFLTALGCIANFSTTYAASSYTSGTLAMADEWNVSQIAILVGVTIYTAAFAVTPMVLAPLSEIYGRRPMFIVSGILYFIGVVFCGVTRLYVGMILSRLLIGCSSAVFAVVVVGVVAEIYEDQKARDAALTWFTAGALFGNGFGPLVSGYIVQRVGWRWLFYVVAIFLAAMVLVFILFWRETRSEVLLSRKAKALNKWLDEQEKKNSSYPGSLSSGLDNQEFEKDRRKITSEKPIRFTAKTDQERCSLLESIRLSVARPFGLLFTEPIVFFFSLWSAFAWSIMFALLIIVPYTFQTVYNFDAETASAMFASMCIATVIITIISLYHDRIASRCFPKSLLEAKSPETCLYFAGVEGALLPIGLFWYGWSVEAHTHWIVPVLALGCSTMGMFSIYLAVFSYLSAAYRQYAASANAGQSLIRNMMAGAFPLFADDIFTRLGFGGAGSLLGGLGVLLTLVPWVLIFYGPQIRARSKFAFAD